jgi:hypothetical protein
MVSSKRLSSLKNFFTPGQYDIVLFLLHSSNYGLAPNTLNGQA